MPDRRYVRTGSKPDRLGRPSKTAGTSGIICQESSASSLVDTFIQAQSAKTPRDWGRRPDGDLGGASACIRAGRTMKAVYKQLLEKSLGAALSAIEVYNKPDFRHREECFVILLVNAWELLLKAKNPEGFGQ